MRTLTRRRIAWLLLVTVVVLLHAVATYELAERMAQFDLANAMPKRIEVAYVRTIEPEVAVAALPAPLPVAKRVPPRVRRPAKAASVSAETEVAAAEAAASAAEMPASAVDELGLAAADGASAPAGAASAPASAAAAIDRKLASADTTASANAAASAAASTVAASAPAASAVASFEWPGATRVSYLLTGNYRGEVSGSAQVEWIRIGDRYQVNLDLIIGPEFAPIISRRMTSEGSIAPSGLVPERYDEDTQMLMRERRRMSVVFESDAVILANGERRERLAGVQDTASQFVQLTYMFSIRPELLRVGNVVAFPLALPRAMDNYAYEVVDDQQLVTPFGTVAAFHLKPRPRLPRRPNQLSAELWIAPELRFLPVRIRIEQDAATYIDLMISKKPEIAAAESATATPVASTRRTP
ncbi:MAG TPA: DUF3108 domain-containing protein [Caldimonas sp.]